MRRQTNWNLLLLMTFVGALLPPALAAQSVLCCRIWRGGGAILAAEARANSGTTAADRSGE